MAVFLCLLALADAIWLQAATGLARSTYDSMVRLRLFAAPPDPRIVIVDIDEASLAAMSKEFGRWPWPRDILASVLSHIEAQGPAAVVWDISFSDPDRLNPGGDAAFAKAAQASTHSHFSVIRLPAANDGASLLSAAHLPSLWLAPALLGQVVASTQTVAVIAPAFEALARSKLALNNAEPDKDGVIRRYRLAHALADGSALKSMPLSVALELAPAEQRAELARYAFGAGRALIAWRERSGLYPRVRFSDTLARAESNRSPASSLPDFAGKVVIIGSTAPSLHDIHPTPLSPTMPGVESLATVIDNALNRRAQHELPRTAQSALAALMCLLIVWTTRRRGSAGIGRLMWVLPAALLLLSYASVHTPVFLDLHLALGFGVALLAALGVWDALRRAHWMARLGPDAGPLPPQGGVLAVASARAAHTIDDADLNRLFDRLAQDLPDARVVCTQAAVPLVGGYAWPQSVELIALVAELSSAQQAQALLVQVFDFSNSVLTVVDAQPHAVTTALDPSAVCHTIFSQWAELSPRGTNEPAESSSATQAQSEKT